MTAGLRPAGVRRSVDEADWAALADALDTHGCALTPELLSADKCQEIAELYERAELFRNTADMARHRFGSGDLPVLHP
jgi:hypothetical protein